MYKIQYNPNWFRYKRPLPERQYEDIERHRYNVIPIQKSNVLDTPKQIEIRGTSTKNNCRNSENTSML